MPSSTDPTPNSTEMTGLLKNIPAQKMRFLDSSSLPDLLRLQAIIAESLPAPDIFVLHGEDFFRKAVSKSNSAIGVFAQNRLIAYSILRIPVCSGKATPDNLGKDIGLPPGDLLKVAHIQAIAVHPACRGNGLQRTLAQAHLKVAEDIGYHHICCTVSPKNGISLANMLSCGLKIEALVPKFQGWWRFILHKDLRKENRYPDARANGGEEQIALAATDLESQLNFHAWLGTHEYENGSWHEGILKDINRNHERLHRYA